MLYPEEVEADNDKTEEVQADAPVVVGAAGTATMVASTELLVDERHPLDSMEPM